MNRDVVRSGRRLISAAMGFALLASDMPAIAQAQPEIETAAKASVKPGNNPIEAFATLPFIEDPRLSPDGTRIAAKVAVDGQQMLVIVDLRKQPNEYRRIGLGENDLNWWKWVNDDWLIAGIGGEVPVEGQPFYVRRTAAVSADAKTINIIAKNKAAQGADDVIWIARDGSPIIYLGVQRSLYLNDPGFWPEVERVDVSTGRTSVEVNSKEGVFDWYADANGTVRMGIGYDDNTRQSRLYYRPNRSTSFRVVSKAQEKRGERFLIPSLFLADPGKALAFDDSDGFTKIKEFNLETLQLGETIFETPGYDVDTLYSDATGLALAGVSYTDTRSRVKWIDPELAAVQADIDKAVGTQRVANVISMSRDRKTLLLDVGGPDRMSLYYRFDVHQGVMQLFGKASIAYGGRAFAPVKSIRYKARDGVSIEAVMTLPVGRDPKNLPLILMPHGGPAARDHESWDWMAQFVADRGYAVIQPNYRGSTGYGTDFEEKGQGEWGRAMQDDLNDAVDWMVKEGIADPKRVCIVGASYGGYAAMRAAQRDGEQFRCAVSYAGVSDISWMISYNSQFLNSNRTKAWYKTQVPDLKSVSPINYAAKFSTPILLMHGKMDRRVPVKQSREMAEKLKAAGKNFRYIEQPKGDHFFSREEDRLQFLKELEAFLQLHNPA